jgi:hypothetical protein
MLGWRCAVKGLGDLVLQYIVHTDDTCSMLPDSITSLARCESLELCQELHQPRC